MGEPKAFASLSSGLLARKGAARPAMRPQGFAQLGGTLEDLGWNDMGFEPPKPALAAVRDSEHDAFGETVPEPAIRHPLAGLTPSGPSVPIALSASAAAELTVPTSPVHEQQAKLADRVAGYEAAPGEDEQENPAVTLREMVPVTPILPTLATKPAAQFTRKEVSPRAAPGGKAKSAFTLRLDPARHLKLRLACALTSRSAQLLVTDALDQFLGAMPELDTMAGNAPALSKAS